MVGVGIAIEIPALIRKKDDHCSLKIVTVVATSVTVRDLQTP